MENLKQKTLELYRDASRAFKRDEGNLLYQGTVIAYQNTLQLMGYKWGELTNEEFVNEEIQRLREEHKIGKITPEELQEATEDFLNSFSSAEKEVEFIEIMSRAHRTLQQSYTRFIMRWVGKMAMIEHFDLRNQNSVLLCRKIIELSEQDRYLPLI